MGRDYEGTGETSTIKIPKKWFGMVSGVVSFLLVIGGLCLKGCDYYRGQVLKEHAIERRFERIEKWKCAMGTKPQDSTEWPKTDWQKECK